MGSIELFRIGRIPVHLDFMFILLAALWSQRYWSSGDVQMYSAGFVLIIGLFVSILLHELGHAMAARIWGIETEAIELNGIGGICHFSRSLPVSVLARTVVGLAGPAANLILWLVFAFTSDYSGIAGNGLLALVMYQLAIANFLLLVYNLLPAFPLDGGRVLEAWLAPFLGPAWAIRVVAVTGFCACVWLVSMALPSNFWMLLMAGLLAFHNFQMLQSVGGFGRR